MGKKGKGVVVENKCVCLLGTAVDTSLLLTDMGMFKEKQSKPAVKYLHLFISFPTSHILMLGQGSLVSLINTLGTPLAPFLDV